MQEAAQTQAASLQEASARTQLEAEAQIAADLLKNHPHSARKMQRASSVQEAAQAQAASLQEALTRAQAEAEAQIASESEQHRSDVATTAYLM